MAVLLGVLGAGCADPQLPEIREPCLESGADLIQALARAYSTQNLSLYRTLLADQDGASFVFYLSDPTELGESYWDVEEELRIHRRMFDPAHPLPGERPVSSDLWLHSIRINLTQTRSFQEMPDLYATNGGPLDSLLWRATEARYSTDVLWDTQSEMDYQVSGDAIFVVIEDLTKQPCDQGKFLLYIWEDLQSPLGTAPLTLSVDTDYKVNGVANFVVIEDLAKRRCDQGKFVLYIWEDLGASPRIDSALALSVEQVSWGSVKELYR